MLIIKKIKTAKGYILALQLRLSEKKLIVLRGRKGYIMCGYLNLKIADKFGDCASIITGVSNIQEALKANIYSVSKKAKKMGIRKGHKVKEVLAIIA